jgi:TPR repeat protein
MAHAAVDVVDMCQKGLGTPPDFARALYWMRHFADYEDSEQMEKLATIYASGAAEPRGPHETPVELLRRAAERRCASLQPWIGQRVAPASLRQLQDNLNELIERYFHGVGTRRDYVAAARWLWQATQIPDPQQSRPSPEQGESPHVFHAIVRDKVVPDSKEKRQLHAAARLVHQALEAKDANAALAIGEMYLHGSELTPQSQLNAWQWLNRAAQLGSAKARPLQEELQSAIPKETLADIKGRFFPPLTASK